MAILTRSRFKAPVCTSHAQRMGEPQSDEECETLQSLGISYGAIGRRQEGIKVLEYTLQHQINVSVGPCDCLPR
jgi:hypothetical protein